MKQVPTIAQAWQATNACVAIGDRPGPIHILGSDREGRAASLAFHRISEGLRCGECNGILPGVPGEPMSLQHWHRLAIGGSVEFAGRGEWPPPLEDASKVLTTIAEVGPYHVEQWSDGDVRIVDYQEDFVGIQAEDIAPLIAALQLAQANLPADVSPAPPAAQEDR